MAIDDVYLLTVLSSQFGSARMNTLAFRLTDSSAVDAARIQPIAVAIKELHRLDQSITLTYTGWKARQIRGAGVTWPTTGSTCTPTGGLGFEGTFSTDTTGGENLNERLPPQCAMVTTLRTGIVGRSHRGRFYAPAWAENQQNDGTFLTLILSNVAARWTAFLATYAVAVPASGFRLGIWSTRIASGCRVLPNGDHERTGPGDPASAFTPVNSSLTRSTVYTQRRRVTGVGL